MLGHVEICQLIGWVKQQSNIVQAFNLQELSMYIYINFVAVFLLKYFQLFWQYCRYCIYCSVKLYWVGSIYHNILVVLFQHIGLQTLWPTRGNTKVKETGHKIHSQIIPKITKTVIMRYWSCRTCKFRCSWKLISY